MGWRRRRGVRGTGRWRRWEVGGDSGESRSVSRRGGIWWRACRGAWLRATGAGAWGRVGGRDCEA